MKPNFPAIASTFFEGGPLQTNTSNLRAKLTEKFYHWSNIDELAFKVT
jgi:hypothetical protein